MKHTNLSITIIFALNLSCVHSYAENYTHVTISELISNPNSYHKKKVKVYGLVNIEHENYRIIDKGCGLSGKLSGKSIWISFIDEKKPEDYTNADMDKFIASVKKYKSFKYKCTWVKGTYNKNIKGLFINSAGGIRDIRDISEKK